MVAPDCTHAHIASEHLPAAQAISSGKLGATDTYKLKRLLHHVTWTAKAFEDNHLRGKPQGKRLKYKQEGKVYGGLAGIWTLHSVNKPAHLQFVRNQRQLRLRSTLRWAA